MLKYYFNIIRYRLQKDKQMKNFFYGACLSLLLVLLNSCEREIVIPQSRQTHFSSSQRESGACDFFVTLDRSGTGVSLDPPGEDELRVISGFVTGFRSGAPPIPCNKLNLAVLSGRFNFDLSAINPARLDLAFNEVENFTPIGGNRIQTATPWGITDGWLGEPGRVQDSCQFRIKFVTSLPVTSRDFLSHPPPTRELRLSGQTFSVTNGGRGNRQINVTSEIRNQLESGTNQRFFLVEPADIAMDYQASNRFMGFFTFRLNVQLNPE